MTAQNGEILRGTCVLVEGQGVLLQGPSGAGKSDLALRLLDSGGELVADDYVRIEVEQGALYASAPPTIAGLLEVRGLGIISVSFAERAPLKAIVMCVEPEMVPRLPDSQTVNIHGVSLPRYALAPFEPSAAAKLRALMRALAAGGFRNDSRGEN
jgi:serine kinase of HPr protein (carbohydrate metabolism regulator)